MTFFEIFAFTKPEYSNF
uniref:Uncharacterized protein n=1 Tax=Arundo donax TaxID=35708 RepID=A0A0A9EJA5_ARUDO